MPKSSNTFRRQFIDCMKVFDSAVRRALAKVLSLYSIPDKYIKVISVMYENNTSGVKIESEVSIGFRIIVGVKEGCVLS